MKEAKTRYGPRKLGEKEFERQQKAKVNESREATVYGSRKGGGERKPQNPPKQGPKQPGPEPSVAPSPEAPAQPHATTAPGPKDEDNPFVPTGDKDGSGYVTLDELKEKLEGEPQLLDLALKAEFRDGQPRVGAVKLFKKIEEGREGGPRPAVMKLLDGHTD